MRGSQTTPIDPGQAEFARGRLDVPRQNVIVSHGSASLDRLKDEILRAVRLHDFVMRDGETGINVNREVLEAIDAIKHNRLNANRRIARLALRSIPVTAANDLLKGDRNLAHRRSYSSRNTVSGSILAARRAWPIMAASAASVREIATAAYGIGLVELSGIGAR